MNETISIEKGPAEWLSQLSDDPNGSTVDGLVLVKGFQALELRPEQRVIMEKAEKYQAHSVFFEAERNGRAAVPQAFVYVSNENGESPDFAQIHRQIWSWGGVPLLYRKTPARIELFRCASKPDFDKNGEEPRYKPFKTLELIVDITENININEPWWDLQRLRNGTLWDDPAICKQLLSDSASAHRHLVDNIFGLYKAMKLESFLSENLQRRLLILSLLIAYLRDRKALENEYFSQFCSGAESFPDVIRNGEALVNMLQALEERFNGHVFELSNAERQEIVHSRRLDALADLIDGKHDARGQRNFWKLYSFGDLPVELISSIYQLFVEDKASSIYTPPALVRLMLEEALSWDRIDHLIENDEVILDPACGSGVYLVEAFKRLILHWRSRNEWREPGEDDIPHLQELLKRVHGIDLEKGAVKLAAFSLCLALCESLAPDRIRTSIRLFPLLEGVTLIGECFFSAKEKNLIPPKVGVIIGNPPFKSPPSTPASIRAADRYKAMNGSTLPDKQLGYLFIIESFDLLNESGVLSMIQPAGLIYNVNSKSLRSKLFERWDVREVLDFVSVRGLFGDADTKIVVIVALAARPTSSRKVLHAVFRRSGKAEAEQGFDIDYYDMHWLQRQVAVKSDDVWRANLLGGGRVLSFIERLRGYPTLGHYVESQGWMFGQGFIAGKKGISKGARHIVGQPLLPTDALSADGIDRNLIDVVPNIPIKDPRPASQFTPPILLIKAHEDFPRYLWQDHYLTFKDKILGIAAPKYQIEDLKRISNWFDKEIDIIRAYCAGTSISSFTRKATALANRDVKYLPFPVEGDFDMSESEEIIVSDIVDYFRDLIRLGEGSDALKRSGTSALNKFNSVFLTPINGIYSDNPLISHPYQSWPGIICQPFSFGPANIDWGDVDQLKDRLDAVLIERKSGSLSVTRITRIYDGNVLYLIKPDRLRFWLRSVALRDSDEVLSDLRAQGF